MKLGLTDRQRHVLDFVKEHFSKFGYPPTLREIGLHMGIRSTNGVNDHLIALERKGLISRRSDKARGITVVGWEDVTERKPTLDVATAEVMYAARRVVETCARGGAILWASDDFSALVRAIGKADTDASAHGGEAIRIGASG